MNIHDIDIELPEPAFTAGTKIGTTTGFFCRDSKIKKGDGAYTREQVIAAIEADRKKFGRNDNDNRKRRGSIVNNASASSEPVALGGQPFRAQPADPIRSEHGVSTTQALITLGKVIAGYRPGEEGWSEYDQKAHDAAMTAPPAHYS